VDIATIGAIYSVFVLVGALLYVVSGWYKFGKPLNEPFDFTKVLKSLAAGGFATLIASASAYASEGFSLYYVVLCFSSGVMFAAGTDKIFAFAKTIQFQKPEA
jgi:hypothetical protein